MTDSPFPHPDPWVDLPRGYFAGAISGLRPNGYSVDAWWMDPCDPRDATARLTAPSGEGCALVWDESTGWRIGDFVQGRQGMRTELSGAVQLGGGVAPAAAEVVSRLLGGCAEPVVHYRSPGARDGLDAFLAGQG